MKNLKYLIIALILIILIIVSILLINNAKKEEEYVVIPEGDRNIIKKTILQKETSTGNYLLIDDLINNFFSYVAQKNQNVENAKAAFSVLDSEFNEKYKITEENLLTELKEYSQFDNYATKEMYSSRINRSEDTLNIYFYVKGILRYQGNIQDVYLLVKQDVENSTHSISLISKQEYDNVVSEGLEDAKQEFTIDKNGYNQTYVKTATDYELCLKHMQDYKNAVNNNPEEAYLRLDEEYRNKRFGSLQNFQSYRTEKVETYGKENFTEYLVNDYGTYKQYVCKDRFGNLYIFEETIPMEYSLKLDTYTIDTEKFKKEYEEGNEQTKVQLNINKFILMINNQDYQAAYNCLDDNFKNNYFKSIDDFKIYVKEHTYRYNNLEFNSFDVKGNVYECGITLTDLTNGEYVDESKGTGGSGYALSWKIMMQLKDGTDFKISFEV